MTKDELIAKLKGYEWTDFECKKSLKNVPDDAYKTVSAFANTEGGWLIFGVSEIQGQLEVTGIFPNAFDAVQNAFLSTLRSGQKLSKIIEAEPHVHEIDGKRILAFFIPESHRKQKPVSLKGDLNKSFIRRGSCDEHMTENELKRYLRDAAEISWDEVLLTDFDLESMIDQKTLSWYMDQFYSRHPEKEKITDAKEFLLKLNFLVHRDDKLALTRAAIMLFGNEHNVRALITRPVVDYQRIDVKVKDWSPEKRWHDRLLSEENLFNTWRGLMARYLRIADHPFKVDPATMRRDDDPPDYIAFREATINLLIHQDYSVKNRKASIKWFIDQFQFWNPGDAVATTKQLLESGEKEVRNPSIVSAFRRIGLSDQAGTGVRAILQNWNELGYRPPEIVIDKQEKSFSLTLHHTQLITDKIQQFLTSLGVNLTSDQERILTLAADQPQISRVNVGMATVGSLEKGHDAIKHLVELQLLTPLGKDTFTLTESIQNLYHRQMSASIENLIKQGQDNHLASALQVVNVLQSIGAELTLIELQNALNLSDRKHFSKNYLKPALKYGWVEMTIPEKPRSRQQKYRYTEKGHEFMNSEK